MACLGGGLEPLQSLRSFSRCFEFCRELELCSGNSRDGGSRSPGACLLFVAGRPQDGEQLGGFSQVGFRCGGQERFDGCGEGLRSLPLNQELACAKQRGLMALHRGLAIKG